MRNIDTVIFKKYQKARKCISGLLNYTKYLQSQKSPKLFFAFQCHFKKCLAFVFAFIVHWKLYLGNSWEENLFLEEIVCLI